jgi:hypothetical protein
MVHGLEKPRLPVSEEHHQDAPCHREVAKSLETADCFPDGDVQASEEVDISSTVDRRVFALDPSGLNRRTLSLLYTCSSECNTPNPKVVNHRCLELVPRPSGRGKILLLCVQRWYGACNAHPAVERTILDTPYYDARVRRSCAWLPCPGWAWVWHSRVPGARPLGRRLAVAPVTPPTNVPTSCGALACARLAFAISSRPLDTGHNAFGYRWLAAADESTPQSEAGSLCGSGKGALAG